MKRNPKLTYSLYGRGIAKLRKNDATGGNLDIAAAKALWADVAEEFVRLGVAAPGATATPARASTPAADCSRAEAHWKSAEDIKTLAVYEDHVARFANCEFAALARARIGAMKK